MAYGNTVIDYRNHPAAEKVIGVWSPTLQAVIFSPEQDPALPFVHQEYWVPNATVQRWAGESYVRSVAAAAPMGGMPSRVFWSVEDQAEVTFYVPPDVTTTTSTTTTPTTTTPTTTTPTTTTPTTTTPTTTTPTTTTTSAPECPTDSCVGCEEIYQLTMSGFTGVCAYLNGTTPLFRAAGCRWENMIWGVLCVDGEWFLDSGVSIGQSGTIPAGNPSCPTGNYTLSGGGLGLCEDQTGITGVIA